MEMEKGSDRWNVMINQLTQGMELARQLKSHLGPSTPHQTREYLIQRILSTYNMALEMVNHSSPMDPSQNNVHGASTSESPRSTSHCSTESSDPENDRRPSKKRKTMPSYVKTVKVSAGAGEGQEGPLNDGYNWRKYGQKDIQGATHPRGYYRCTHRHTQGCFATKQVQKSNDDPTIVQVIYKGQHTCSQQSHLTHPSTCRDPPPVPHVPVQHHPQQEKQNHSQPIASDPATLVLQPQLKVETEELDTADRETFFFRSFSFSSAFIETAGKELANNWFISASPATSDSNHLETSPGHIAGGTGGWTPESDIYDHGGSDPNSPVGRLEFTLDELGIDPNFPFDNPELFS